MLEAVLPTLTVLASMAHSVENAENWREVTEHSFRQGIASQPLHPLLIRSIAEAFR